MILTLIGRNLKLYFRDKVAVFFSLLSVIIVVVLFVLFLAQTQVDSVTESISGISEDKISYLVHSWILAGLLSITTVTSVLGGFGSMVNDREKRIIMAFRSAPIKEWVYPFANVVSSFIIGIVISIISLTCYSICINLICGYTLPAKTILLSLSIIFFSSLINSIIMGCLCSFLKTISAFTSASILIGTCVGFINGLYVPLGSLSKTIVDVLAVFPSLHIATIFRNVVTMPAINEVFSNAPEIFADNYSQEYGLVLEFSETDITTTMSIIYACCVGLLCLIIMIYNVKKKKKEL